MGQHRKETPLCIRLSKAQRREIQRAAAKITAQRGELVKESTLAREIILAEVVRINTSVAA